MRILREVLHKCGWGPSRARRDAEGLAQARRHVAQGDTSAAHALLADITRACPGDADAWALWGFTWYDLGNTSEARSALARALALNPRHPDALLTMGVLDSQDPDPALALGWYERAHAVQPDDVHTRYHLAQRLFFVGQYRRAFHLLQARHQAVSGRANPLAPLPVWQGEPLEGKRVFVWCDWGGLGDHLQFVRYVPLLRARTGAAHITLGCQKVCVRLFASVEGVDAVVAPGVVPSVEVHVPLLDLPLWFDTGPDNVPAALPYLRADALLCAQWRQRLEQAPGGWDRGVLRVGLVWETGRWHQGKGYDQLRLAKTIPAQAFAALASLDASFVSLQKDAETLPPLPLVDLTAALTDLAETAALIANLDVVVSADTAVAHLAAALGKPVVLLLRKASGMFWSEGERSSPWYPGITILRQTREGCWDDVLAALATRLERMKHDPQPGEAVDR